MGVVLGGAGKVEERFHRRSEQMAMQPADLVRDAGEVEKGGQVGIQLLAAISAQRAVTVDGYKPRSFPGKRQAAALGATSF
jgi:hypothetical protein